MRFKPALLVAGVLSLAVLMGGCSQDKPGDPNVLPPTPAVAPPGDPKNPSGTGWMPPPPGKEKAWPTPVPPPHITPLPPPPSAPKR